MTVTQEQVSQYSQYMNTAPEQHQFTGVPPQDQHQFSGLVSSSISNQYASEAVPLYGNQPSVVDSTAGNTQELLSHGVPLSWPTPSDTVTQMSTNTAQSSDHLPQLNTTANITGSGPPTVYSAGSEQNSHQMTTEGFNTQYTGASSQQPMTSVLPNQMSMYSNFASQIPSSEPSSVQADIHNLMPSVTHQSFSVTQPVLNTTQSNSVISQPVTSAAATTFTSQSRSQTQQPGQKNEPPSSNEDTTKNTKDEKKKDSDKVLLNVMYLSLNNSVVKVSKFVMNFIVVVKYCYRRNLAVVVGVLAI